MFFEIMSKAIFAKTLQEIVNNGFPYKYRALMEKEKPVYNCRWSHGNNSMPFLFAAYIK